MNKQSLYSFLCECSDNVQYFDSSKVEHIPEEIKKFIGNKNITTNIFRTQAYDSILCGYSLYRIY